jgi:hypothetical protein
MDDKRAVLINNGLKIERVPTAVPKSIDNIRVDKKAEKVKGKFSSSGVKV